MPFELRNAPAIFQHCMLSLFSDMVERFLWMVFQYMEISLTNACIISSWSYKDTWKRTWHL